VEGKSVKKAILILIFVTFLSGCNSTTPLTFKGDTKNWHIEMVATNDNSNEQQVSVTYKYKGKIVELKKFKHLKLSYDVATFTNGSQKINADNGITEKEFTLKSGGNGKKITKECVPKVTIVLGENNIKETTNLMNK
jgi:uncharacterized lipoprotein YehR (DUF1307 family)